MFWQGIEIKSFRRASRERLSLSLSLILKLFWLSSFMFGQGIQIKSFRRASRESLSLSLTFKTFPTVTLYALAGHPDQTFSPRFARKFKFKFDL